MIATEPFFPATLEGWLKLAVVLITWSGALLGFGWKLAMQPILAQINGLGARVKEGETAIITHTAHIGKLDRGLENSQRDRTEIHDRIGRIEGAVEKMVSAMERERMAWTEEEGGIKERLVRIETKVDLALPRRTE